MIILTIPHQKVIIKIIKQLDERITIFKKQCNTYTFMDIAKMAIQIVKENEVIKKEIRQTKETLDAAPADRADIKEQCEKRLAVYKQFVPEDLNEDAIREIIKGVLSDLSIEQATPKDKGRIMKELMPKVKGKAEGSIVNKIVGEFMN